MNTLPDLTKPTYEGGRHGYAIIYHNPRTIVTPSRRPRGDAEASVMTGEDDENCPETEEPAEVGAFDPDVEIHAAMLARERAGGSYPDGDALEAMEEPLHRLTSAAVLFSDITAESSPGPELRMRGCLSWPSRSAAKRSGCFGCITGIRRGIVEARGHSGHFAVIGRRRGRKRKDSHEQSEY